MAAYTNAELNSGSQAAYFQWTILVMGLYAFAYLAIMLSSAGARGKTFSKEFMA